MPEGLTPEDIDRIDANSKSRPDEKPVKIPQHILDRRRTQVAPGEDAGVDDQTTRTTLGGENVQRYLDAREQGAPSLTRVGTTLPDKAASQTSLTGAVNEESSDSMYTYMKGKIFDAHVTEVTKLRDQGIDIDWSKYPTTAELGQLRTALQTYKKSGWTDWKG